MTKLKMQEIGWAEMKPDTYGGDDGETHIPGWDAHFDGDMDGEYNLEELQLSAQHFPPGTKVVISVPSCPECDTASEVGEDQCQCGFDWKQWTEGEYS